VVTPLLDAPLHGSLYVAQQGNAGASQGANPFNSLLAVYVVAEGSGVRLKLAGRVDADSTSGQLTIHFEGNPPREGEPQLPFSELKVKAFGGPRAALSTPSACGKYEASTALTPWSGGASAVRSSSFNVEGDCAERFSPAFSAGTLSGQAGAYSPLSLQLARSDGEQGLLGLSVTLPPGLLAKLSGVRLCGDAEAAGGTCPEASRIGSVVVGAGAGPSPVYVTGGIYLTGPYRGGPFGEVVEVPAVAGPFNLGTVVVRGAIKIDPMTAQASVVSDPFPTILQGIQLRVKSVHVALDRSEFTVNPTNCSPLSVTGAIAATGGANAAVSSPFEAANCANLPFKPSVTVSTQGKTSKANGAALVVNVAQKAGEADIHKVNLQLPLALPSRLTTLQKACAARQFESNPAGCPEGSFVGTARAHTPLLAVPLTGPAILVSHGGAAFPDLVFVLQGEGIRIDLVGNTDIKKSITSSRFETVPDAPISSFETILPEGPHSVLGAFGNLCTQSLIVPTTITGQNGAVVRQSTHVGVAGCGQRISISKERLTGNSVSVTVSTTAQGLATITGGGLRRTSKTLGVGSHTIKVPLTATGRSARGKHLKIKIKASLTVGRKTVVAKTASLRL
jgi:hypothetical protein